MDVVEERILMKMIHNRNFEGKIYDLMRRIV
jgi:hypothetical protein